MRGHIENQEVQITGQRLVLPGNLSVPPEPKGLVIFAHGSGSSRLSPRNQQVAQSLNQEDFATLLFDLLTRPEAVDRQNVFDIPLLADRLLFASFWAMEQPELSRLPQAYFGASTGAGAALWAAAEQQEQIFAVVSRGGRPDLALPRLSVVQCPTLLLVGGLDDVVIELNERACRYLNAQCEMRIVEGATHLFEEPGTLEEVSTLAGEFLSRHVPTRRMEERERRAA